MRSESSVSDRTRGVLAYCVGGIWFGARVEEVAGLMQADRPAPLPHQREPLSGVIAFRGTMVPTFEISNYLGLDAPRSALRTRSSSRAAPTLRRRDSGDPAPGSREGIARSDLAEADPEFQSMFQSVRIRRPRTLPNTGRHRFHHAAV